MGNKVTYAGRTLRINSSTSRVEYYNDGAGAWMDDGPAPDGATDLYLNKGVVMTTDGNGVKYQRSEYGAFTAVKDKSSKSEESCGSRSSGSIAWKIICFPFKLVWWIFKAVLFIGTHSSNK